MDTPVLKNSKVHELVSSPRYAHLRLVLLIIIVAAALSVIGWFVYTHYFEKPPTAAEVRQATLDEVKRDSPPVPDAVKAPVLKELETQNNPTAKKTKDSSPTFTDAQKAAVLQQSFSN